ncbi:GH3 auxin-responsive promoter family protein [Oscillatoria sp. FACHB-1407]|uniref:GH3 auxin-responsive promoter family protein n=1 Tax=Oscillatoria sp. FACHB-1407 TaxID=2692847 RepID=UPI001687F04A|nr:GH3 auxin-responsive promoter family protein [Oscillatoria sp. FACHB-1407]MBD2462546.1 GH3 auxin-responsive promoter family protein [Oscillatoria sp. FACHB-1407]
MTNPLLSLLTVVIEASRASFVRKTRQTAAIQEQFLLTLLRAHQNTALGRDFGLADIKTVDQFRERVPILPYSRYEPYIERVAKGEHNILTPDPVRYLNLTSGSTGKQKLVPVTKRSRQVLNLAQRTSMGFAAAAARKWGLPIGKMLLTSSVQLLGRTSGGIEYGPVSVGNLRHSHPFYRQVFAQPFEALQASDSLARHYLCLLFALCNPKMAVIGANFPVLALRLCDYLECYAEDLIQDIETGAIAHWLKLEPELRVKLEKIWSADPKRADELRHILKTEDRLTPKSVWPDLSFIITARGGTSDFYFERFPTYFGDTPIFGGVYASAEATFGIYYDFNNDGSILAIENGFFEFIPEDQWEVEQPKTLLAEEVIPGHYYRILVTNYNGLYRYDIGDVVEVLGFYEKAPLLAFRHRLGGLLSSTTEKTTEFHATQVMQLLQQEFNVPLENFCITLSEDVVPAPYLVNIELPPGHTLPDPKAFLSRFDHRLKEIHVSYEVKRRDQVPPPRLRILEHGSFAEVRQRLLKRGIPESQLKFPHISEDRKILSGLRVETEVRLVEG